MSQKNDISGKKSGKTKQAKDESPQADVKKITPACR